MVAPRKHTSNSFMLGEHQCPLTLSCCSSEDSHCLGTCLVLLQLAFPPHPCSGRLDQVTQHLVGIQSFPNGTPERDLLVAHSIILASLSLQAL